MDFIQINNKNQYQRKLLVQVFHQLQTMQHLSKLLLIIVFKVLQFFGLLKLKSNLENRDLG